MFIAVNSGTSKGEVEGYLKSVNSKWPAIVDTSRAFEKAFGISISLQNIYQVRAVLPDGGIRPVSPRGIDEEVEKLLPQAAWRVDPAGVPAPLKSAWRSLEFGNFAAAAPAVKKAASASDAATKKAAEAMNAAILAEIEARLKAGGEAKTAGKAWAAYKAFRSVERDFKGFDEAKPASPEVKSLGSDKQVKTELRAAAALEPAKKLLEESSTKKREEGKKILMSVAASFPDTEAAATARALLSGN